MWRFRKLRRCNIQERPAEVNELQQQSGGDAVPSSPSKEDKKREKEEKKKLEKERKEREKREKEEAKRRKKEEEKLIKEQSKQSDSSSPQASPQKAPVPAQQKKAAAPGVRPGKMVRTKVYLLEDRDYEVDIDVSTRQMHIYLFRHGHACCF